MVSKVQLVGHSSEPTSQYRHLSTEVGDGRINRAFRLKYLNPMMDLVKGDATLRLNIAICLYYITSILGRAGYRF